MILDQRKIELLKQNHEKTFEEIYHETKRGVYAMIFSITKSHPMTEDLMQEVYMKMIIKIDQYRVGTNFINWLLQIAKNQAIDTYRRNQKTTNVDESDMDMISGSEKSKPDEEDTMQRMLEILDDTERQIVMLKVIDELTHREIAKIVKKPIGTVLWLYQKAMDKLKHYQG
ncbi:MAG: RNA polymerase sigma factor [Acholeplasmataceae bacterium]|jgi:RNA polymerase sigma-70 factor (ECF subfamily)|nr:RNA polymerase sigma factor [Acholeplasmataceae bacterium]